MLAVSHVGAWGAMEEIRLSEAKFCQIVSERKQKGFYKSLFTEYQLVKNPVFTCKIKMSSTLEESKLFDDPSFQNIL